MDLIACPTCSKAVIPTDYFCPQCGKKLKDKAPRTTISRQIVVYAVSFFLPPFGLIPAIAYLRQKDSKSKKVGLVAIFLTILSILLSLWFATRFLKLFNQQLNNQINFYNEINY